jgi:hypothetical protein
MTRGFWRFLRRNTIALLALFLALGGTSFAAATLINGKQIKPHTIAKNRLTNTAIKQLKGNRGSQGLRGPTGTQGVQGTPGSPGTARAYAHVDVAGTLDAPRSKNFTAVSNPSAGQYCLTIDPALGINTATVPWVVSVDYNTSPGQRLFAFYAPFSCPSGQLGVLTANEDGGGGTTFTFSNEAFSIIVP